MSSPSLDLQNLLDHRLSDRLTALLLVSSTLFAQEPEGIPLADVEGDPSSTVAGCVSVITGHYTDHQNVMTVAQGQSPSLLHTAALYLSQTSRCSHQQPGAYHGRQEHEKYEAY